MRPYNFFTTFSLACLILLGSCRKDKTDLSLPIVKLSTDKITGKSERQIQVSVSLSAPLGLGSLQISKGVNLKTDSNYGTNGILSVNPPAGTGNSWNYAFTYTLSPDEVDKLVGFNFKLIDAKGRSAEKDLTVYTTVSGAQTIFTHKWALVSKFWKTGNPPAESIKDCEKDDTYQWNRDSTMSINYGKLACDFDGFNVYDKWTLSADEKTFTQTYHSLFDPTKITVEKYTVISIASDKLVMSIPVDLSWLGAPYTDHELFIYTFNAVP